MGEDTFTGDSGCDPRIDPREVYEDDKGAKLAPVETDDSDVAY